MARVGRKSGDNGDNGRDILGCEERGLNRLDIIKEAAIRIMARNFTPDERELDLDSWGFDDE